MFSFRKTKAGRVIAFLVMVMMVASLLPTDMAFAADPAADPVIGQDHPENPGDVMLFKQVESVPGKLNTYKVTLRIEAKDAQKTNDIVLVIDISGSMNGAKLNNAKAAATQFVNQLLTENHPNTRISLVTFGTNPSQEVGFVNYQNKAQLLTDISNLTAAGGTHTQGGVHLARTALEGSNADVKQVVLLSDGQPTYSYALTNPDNYLIPYGIHQETSANAPASAYRYTGINSRVGDGSNLRDDYERTGRRPSIYKYYNNGNSAIAEAGFVKGSPTNATLHTIALDAGTEGTPILQSMASDGKFYNTTDPTELTGIFQTIAADIQAAMQDVEVSDPMGTGFNVAGGAVGSVEKSQGEVAITNNNTQIDWDVGPVLLNQVDGHPMIKYAELSYIVEINSSILGVDSPDGQYNTNAGTSVSYKDINGVSKTMAFPTPSVKPLIIELKKELKDAEGNEIATDPYDRNFKLNVQAAGAYDLDYFLDGNTSDVMVDIKLDVEHTISEEAETRGQSAGNLDDYETTIKWNSWADNHTGGPVNERTFTGFKVPKNNDDPINTTITITNQEKALGELRINKEFYPNGLDGGTSATFAGEDQEFTVNVKGTNIYDPNQEVYNENHTVKVGETIYLTDLAYGEYTVTEINNENFDTEYEDNSGTTTDGKVTLKLDSKEAAVTVKNAPKGDLTRTFTATKTWVNGDPTQHTPVDLTLLVNGNETTTPPGGASPTISDPFYDSKTNTSVYTYTWNGLPKWGGDGKEIAYSVLEEQAPQYYVVSYNADKTEVTNTYQSGLKTTQVSANKIWGGGPAEKPDIWFTLYRQVEGGQEERARTGAGTTGDLIVPAKLTYPTTSVEETVLWGDDQGKQYTYFVKETDADGNPLAPENYEKSGEGTLTITNTYKSPKENITANKIWDGGAAPRPTVWFDLYRQLGVSGTPEKVAGAARLELANGITSVTWDKMDKTDENGVAYIYSVKEVDVNGQDLLPANYKKTEDGLDVTNKYQSPTEDVTVEKVWVNGENIRPDSVKVTLTGKATDATDVVENLTLTKDAQGEYKASVNIPTHAANGNPYTYTLQEEGEDGGKVTFEVGGQSYDWSVGYGYDDNTKTYTVTNSYAAGQIADNIIATKVWDLSKWDNTTYPNMEYPNAKFELWRKTAVANSEEKVDGVDAKAPATPGAGDTIPGTVSKTVDFGKQYKTDTSGNTYTYYVKEVFDLADIKDDNWEVIPDATDGLKITNRFHYNNENDDTHDDELVGKLTIKKEYTNIASRSVQTFNAKVTGPYGYSKDVVLNPSQDVVLTGLAYGDYTVKEEDGTTYTASYNPTDGKVQLEKDDANKTVTVKNEATTAAFTDIVITKTWQNGPARAADDVTMTLKRKVEGGDYEDATPATASSEAVGTDGHKFTYTFASQPKFKEGTAEAYTYTVEESIKTEIQDLYTAGTVTGDQKTGFAVTNTYVAPTSGEFTAIKVWSGNEEVTRPTMVFTLWRKAGTIDEAVPQAETKEVDGTTTEAKWTGLTTTNNDGQAYTFYVKEAFKETAVGNDNWALGEYDATTKSIINTVKSSDEDLGKLTVKKNQLVAGSTVKSGSKSAQAKFGFTVTGPYGYSQTFDLAPGESKELTGLYFGDYKVEETTALGYTPTYSPGQTATLKADAKTATVEVTNTSGGDGTVVEVNASKTWVNGPDTDHTGIALTLKRISAKEGSTSQVVDADPTITGTDPTFNYKWTNLAKHDEDGYEYTYTVEEPGQDTDGNVTINGNTYAVTQTENAITNTYTQPQTDDDVVATKTWNAQGNSTPEIKFELWRKAGENGPEEKVENATSVENNQVNFGKQLQTDIKGVAYTYFVKEVFDPQTEAEKWTVTGEGTLHITNTYSYTPPTSDTITITTKKEWVKAPKVKPTIELQLYQNGEKLGDPVEFPNGKTTHTWTVDKTDPTNDQDYTYDVKEVKVPKNYKAKVTQNGNTFTITNTRTGGGGGGGDVTPTPPEPPALIKDDHFAYMFGYPDGSFHPNGQITRAEVTVMFSRLMVEKMEDDVDYPILFSDIEDDAWYARNVAFMTTKGIIKGYPDGTFRPDAPVTRAEFAAIASRFDHLVDGTSNFTDVPQDHWAKQVIDFAYTKGWVGGYPDGTFKPENHQTRAETISIVNKMLERVADKTFVDSHKAEMANYTDVDGSHWAYYPIMEACNGHDFEWVEKPVEEHWLNLKDYSVRN